MLRSAQIAWRDSPPLTFLWTFLMKANLSWLEKHCLLPFLGEKVAPPGAEMVGVTSMVVVSERCFFLGSMHAPKIGTLISMFFLRHLMEFDSKNSGVKTHPPKFMYKNSMVSTPEFYRKLILLLNMTPTPHPIQRCSTGKKIII